MSVARPIVVGLGELLWDCFGATRRPGGAPANVAFHARQLGAEGVICSRVGNDALGGELVAFVAEHGLDATYIQRDAHLPTSQVTVHEPGGDGPSYTIHENVAWDRLEYTDALVHLMPRVSAVCFGTLIQRSPVSRATVHACLDHAANALVVYDVNLRPPFVEREWIEASLARCTAVKLNHDEERALDGLLELGTSNSSAFAEVLMRRYNIEVVCITRGGDGCYVQRGRETAEVSGCPVQVADTVGAGDAFTAALTWGLLARWPLSGIAQFANQVGALVASRPGAMPNLASELATLRR